MAKDEIRLIEPTDALRDAYLEFIEEFLAAGERFHQDERQEARGDFSAFVRRLRERAAGAGLPQACVPDSMYWLVRGGRVLGTSRLRHRLTAGLKVEGGHIGYDVRPSERRKGLGTRMLALTLAKARQRGLRRVLVTCDKDNTASARVIRKNGGRLDSEGISPGTGKTVQRYWIELEDGPGAMVTRSLRGHAPAPAAPPDQASRPKSAP